MKKRSDTRSPLEVDEFGSSSGKGVGEIEAVFELDSFSNSVLPMVGVDGVFNSFSPAEAEAAEAPSRSDFEQVDSTSRSEVELISRGASPASLI